MARGRIYKSEVADARAALLAQGRHPSIDAVRVALGNTGSRTTIHRLLKELGGAEGEGDSTTASQGLEESIQALVVQLASGLRDEADGRIATIEIASAERIAQLEASLTAAEQCTREAQQAEGHVRTALQTAEAALSAYAQAAARRDTELAQLIAQREGLSQQLAERQERLQEAQQRCREADAALERSATLSRADALQALEREDSFRLQLAASHEQLDERTSEIRRLEREGGDIRRHLDTAMQDVATLRHGIDRLNRQHDESKATEQAHGTALRRIAELEQTLDDVRRQHEADRAAWLQGQQAQFGALQAAIAQKDAWREWVATHASEPTKTPASRRNRKPAA
jgi:chromosome segregation ATPase